MNEKKEPVRLDIGRGGRRKGWLTVDIEPANGPDIIADCRSLEDIADESVDEIFSAHMLEHIHEWEVLPALTLWRRRMKKDGIVTVYVPDNELAWKMYFDSQLSDDELSCVIHGSAPDDKHLMHRSFFWYQRLEKIFYRAGFRNVIKLPPRGYRMEFGVRAKKVKDESYFKEIEARE